MFHYMVLSLLNLISTIHINLGMTFFEPKSLNGGDNNEISD